MQRRTKKLLIVFVAAPLLLAAAGGALVVARQTMVERSVREAHRQGIAAFERGDYKAALPLLSRYVSRNQTDVPAILMLARACAMVPRPDGTETAAAARHAAAALAIDPGNTDALELLIDYYSQLRFVTELGRVCDQLLAVKPDHAKALSGRAQSLLALGKYDEARAAAEKLSALDPSDADPFRLVLEIGRQQGASPERLASQAAELAARFPESFELAIIHAQTLLSAGQLAPGTARLQAAEKLTPATLRGVSDALRLSEVVAALHRVSGQDSTGQLADSLRQSARTMIEKAMRNERLREGVAAIATGWEWRGGRLAEARRWLDAGAPADAPSTLPWLGAWRAVIARDEGKKDWKPAPANAGTGADRAAHIWSEIIAVMGEIDAAQWSAARTRLEALRVPVEQLAGTSSAELGAAQDRAATEAGDAAVMMTFLWGTVSERLGEWRAAVRQWTEAADAEPSWSLPLARAAQLLLERGQRSAAYDAAVRAFRARTGALEALTLARVLVALEESGDGSPEGRGMLASLLADLSKMDLVRAESVLLKGRAAAVRGDANAARGAMSELLELTPPATVEQMLALSESMRAAGISGWEPLIAAAEKAGGRAVAFVRASDAASQGRREEALAELRKAASDRTSVEAVPFLLQEVRLLSSAGAREEARSILRQLSETHEGVATVQLDVLDQDVTWTDAALVDDAVKRLRAASGEKGIEWRLADATRLLTFSPEESKAQAVMVSLNSIIREDPGNAQALALLGEWSLILKDTSAAASYLARAIESPDAPATLYPRLIRLLLADGRADEARARLEQFARVRAISPELRRTRAALFAELGQADRAGEDLAILAAAGGAADKLSFAAAQLQGRDRPAALETIEQVLATPDLPRQQFVAALGLLADAGQQQRALELYDERSGPGSGASQIERAALLERAGQRAEAEAVLKAAFEKDGSAEAVVELARLYLRTDRHTEASMLLSSARSKGLTSDQFDSLEALAAAHTKPLDPDQQQAVLDAIAPGPLRDLAEATRWYDAHPTEHREFIARLRKITAARPDLVLAWQFLVRTLIQEGELDQAVTAARSASAASPQSPDAARMEASTLMLAGRPADARAPARRWRELESASIEPSLMLAAVEIGAGAPNEARALLEPLWKQAETLAASTPLPAWLSLVSSTAKLGEGERAQTLAGLRTTDEPDLLPALASIAVDDSSSADAARQWLDRLAPALQARPDGATTLIDALCKLAMRTGDSRDVERALAVITPRIDNRSATIGEMLLAASMLERVGRASEAGAMYRHVIDREPDQWIALNNLAYALLGAGQSADALPLATRARDSAEKQGVGPAGRSSVYQTLALAQLRTGDAAQALVTVRRALEIDASIPEAILIEVEALEARGDAEGARGALTTFLSRPDALGSMSDTETARARQLAERLGVPMPAAQPTSDGRR
ncbi:MAG: hypothetical protein SFZ24_12280 [Planctomycetota bacterium]|nr:hypothetical protein [Planctomycetota bacterium]